MTDDEIPPTEIPATELPATELPATEIPATELPADKIPADKIPAEESPPDAADEVGVIDDVEVEAGSDPSAGTAESAAPPVPVPDVDVDLASARTGWRRWARSVRRPKLTGAGLVIAILVGLLGFALIAQVKSNSDDSTLSNDRPDDLVRILSDLDARKDRLSTEIAQLQGTVRQLASGAQGRQAALDEAAKRADELGILAGTLPAQGPGLDVTFQPQRAKIEANDVLNAVEELRGAGAEAMSIAGENGTVRIVAATYFTDDPAGINVGGQVLVGPLTIAVIGDPQTMQTALNIPGGVVESVRNGGGNVLIAQPTLVLVTALHTEQAPRYAEPAS